jgi:D-glycero-D-manno-heptose 1,7-bisphosphate phosphatase
MKKRALFLDRDGTLVLPRHFPSRPEQLVLFDGIGPELQALQAAGFRMVVITNQSGLAHGYFTEAELDRMHAHLAGELAQFGVQLDGIYYCPHHPEGALPALAVTCVCRKPQPGLLLQAAADLDLDLPRSWFLGDILDDVEAGNRAGCRTVLIDLGTESLPCQQWRTPHFVARNTVHGLQLVRAVEQLGPACDLSYLPPTWQRAGGAPSAPPGPPIPAAADRRRDGNGD